MYIYVGFRIDRYFCQRLSANLVDSFSRDFEESEERVREGGLAGLKIGFVVEW